MGNHLSIVENENHLPLWALNVAEFSSFEDRNSLMCLTKGVSKAARDDKIYKWLCKRLSVEAGLYVPPTLPKTETSWKKLFLELYGRRSMWAEDEELSQREAIESQEASEGLTEEEIFLRRIKRAARKRNEVTDRFKVNVFARFRPLPESKESGEMDDKLPAEEDSSLKVTLPLHQRLSMIRMSGGAKSKREALRVLASEGEWFGEKWSNISMKMEAQEAHEAREKEQKENSPSNNATGPSEEEVMASEMTAKEYRALRSRKPLRFLKSPQNPTIAKVQTVDSGMAKVVVIAPDVGLREFAFDGVLPVRSKQSSSYDLLARRLVMDFLNGYNGTCIAYGQTAAGKTHTMMGPPDVAVNAGVEEGDRGIIPRACHEVLTALSDKENSRARLGLTSSLAVSYVEVYGDLVSDLLRNGTRVSQSKVAAQSFVLSGATEQRVESLDHIMDCLARGDAQKRRAATAMNDRSSRAHSIFILSLTQKCEATGVERRSKLFLADLGGSEQVKKSKVDTGVSVKKGEDDQFSTGFHMGERMKEAVNINLGLLALKKVIKALNEKSCHVPYQDSKLTMLLSQGLGGDCKTSVIVCSAMDPKHASETVQTLRFGENCSLLENEAGDNANMLASVLAALDEEIQQCEAEIEAKERWEHRDVEREDVNAEEGTFEAAAGGKEVKKVSVLVGAEKERLRLNELLKKKASFVGMDDFEKEKQSRAVGFGRDIATLYGVGNAFEETADAVEENERFVAKLDHSKLSSVVRAKGAKGWTTTEDLEHDPAKLEKIAKKAKRSKLVYSGISA